MLFTDIVLSDEEKMVRDMVRAIVTDHIAPKAIETDEEEKFPWTQIAKLKEVGLLGIMVPEEYGGINASKLAYVLVIEEIAKWCAATALVYFTQTHGLLPVALAGSEEQQRKYLPVIASGEKLAAFAVTEPNAGSDAGGMQTFAQKVSGGYVLNGVDGHFNLD